MKVLITGIAGFIGYHTALKFHREGYDVVGVDNYNDYYSPKLKTDRVLDLVAQSNGQIRTVGIDIKSKNFLDFMLSEKPDLVIHLAASAGVRDSLKEPIEYIENNITGTQHVINACEAVGIKNVIYATTSCVMHDCPLPWNEEHMAKHHLSPYGYTKATNEHQFHISKIKNAVGLRFFTVYGPWGRPDMALYGFADKISKGEPITVYNNGDMKRDFTYVNDIVQGIYVVSQNMTERDIYCIGYGESVPILDFIWEIENNLELPAIIEYAPLHPADAKETLSDTTKIQKIGYKPTTSVSVGIGKFIEWYKEYHK